MESDLDSSFCRIDWVRLLVSLFDDQQVPVHTAAWQALDVLFKSVPKVELESLVGPPAPDDGENFELAVSQRASKLMNQKR